MLKLGKVVPFVMKAMQPPRLEALTAAVNSLKDLVSVLLLPAILAVV